MDPVVVTSKSGNYFRATIMAPTGGDKIGQMFYEFAIVEDRNEADSKSRAAYIVEKIFSIDPDEIVFATYDEED